MGYYLYNNCTFLHTHFCICTLSGAVLPQELVDSNIEQERSDLNLRQMSNQMQQVLGGKGDFHRVSYKAWLCSVHPEYVSPMNQKSVEGFSPSAPRGTSEALLLLCGLFMDTARKQNIPAESMHQRADRCHFLALLLHPGSHCHKTRMP